MAKPNTTYKIAVLQMVDACALKLTNHQVCQFFTSRGYTDYFTIQQAVGELVQTGHLATSRAMNHTLYTLTAEGQRTLEALYEKVSDSMRQDILAYLKEISADVDLTNSLSAYYDKAVGGGYEVTCRLSQNGRTKLELNLHVSSEQQAKAICTNWSAKYEDTYFGILDSLT